jgi:2-oxoisovalerate dehydrogenase E2 component (dihydrolipoyl transacylase)
MRIELPHVGESVTEGVIGKWLKQVGDSVEKYDPLVEVVTDKVNMEVPAPATGILTSILVEEGATVPMGEAIAEMAVEGGEDEVSSEAPGPASHDEAAPEAPSPTSDGQAKADRVGTLLRDVAPVGPTGSGGPISTGAGMSASGGGRFSPAVLRLAEQHDVDLSQVTGTGISGRVTRKDVQSYIDSRDTKPASTEDSERVPLTPVRRMIADNMVKSAATIPEAWTLVEADVTGLVRLRERMRADFARREGVDLTYLAFVVKVVAEALKEHRMVNSSWDGDAIILKKRVNIGVAVAAPGGLVVPVIHDADRLSVAGVARAIDDLVMRARAGKLGLGDVQGGTFTINNTGALGSVVGKAIINPPEAAIVNTESIVKRPVVVGDAIAIRSIMNLCLTFDHRILDGREASAFIADVKRRLEAIDPELSV